MFEDIDLTQLSEISTNEKTVLSLYISSSNSLDNLEKSYEKIRRVLQSNHDERDEREHFEENVKAVEKYLYRTPLTSESLCIFSCWGLDYFQAYDLPVPAKDLVWFDSSPYIRPLAELQEEYENVAVVIADNKKARIFLISSAIANHESTVEGNIKNHVKKGGWSQQRYERRRDKQLLIYSREIVDALMELEKTDEFRWILLVGGKEILHILYENLPPYLQERVAQKAVDLRKGEDSVNKEIMELLVKQEHQSEHDLWEKIRSEYLRNGLGVIGVDNVLQAVSFGQVEEIIVNREYAATGTRCRVCDNLHPAIVEICSKCGSNSLFSVDLINEIVELANLTGASVDFCDHIESLGKAGNIAASLRYMNQPFSSKR